MKFGSWTYNSFQMSLDKVISDADLSGYIPNEQWNLTYAVVRRHRIKYPCCPEEYHDVTFYFGLQRKPLYYIYNLIMPCILLSSLAMLGFFMPYDVGVVKVSLSITLILSLTVFLLLVAEMMPRTSEEVPLIGKIAQSTHSNPPIPIHLFQSTHSDPPIPIHAPIRFQSTHSNPPIPVMITMTSIQVEQGQQGHA